jgi:hypothetical protein
MNPAEPKIDRPNSAGMLGVVCHPNINLARARIVHLCVDLALLSVPIETTHGYWERFLNPSLGEFVPATWNRKRKLPPILSQSFSFGSAKLATTLRLCQKLKLVMIPVAKQLG